MIHTTTSPGTSRAEVGTSLGCWALVLAAAAALLCARLPSFVAAAERAVAAQSDALDDRALADAAVAVGAVSAVAVHVMLLGLGALLAALLERAVGPRALGARMRIGVGGLAFAVVVLGQQVAALGLGVAAVERSWPMWLAAAAAAMLAPAAFAAARSSAAAYAKALLVSCGTVVLLCAG